MEIPTQRVAVSLLPLVLACVSLYAQTRSLATRQILSLDGPSVLKIEVHDKQGALAAQASGVVIAPGGIVATNAHVVSGACNLYIKKSSGSLIAVTGIVQSDPDKDIAILRFDSKDLPVATLGDSHALQVGDRVVAIGSPLGLEQTVSEGIVSGLRTFENGRPATDWIQMTAPISPGSSGGGLFNGEGELIGLTTFGLRDSQNLNFAAPLAEVMDLLKRGGEKPWSTWASSCDEAAPSAESVRSLDAMVLDQQLLGHAISDPQLAEVLKMLNGGTAPANWRDVVLAGQEWRSYSFTRVSVLVVFVNGRCLRVAYFPGFAGSLPLGLSWGKSRSEIQELIGTPSYAMDPGPEKVAKWLDTYEIDQYYYALQYGEDARLLGMTVLSRIP